MSESPMCECDVSPYYHKRRCICSECLVIEEICSGCVTCQGPINNRNLDDCIQQHPEALTDYDGDVYLGEEATKEMLLKST